MDQAEDEEMHRLDKVAGEVGEAGRGEEGRKSENHGIPGEQKVLRRTAGGQWRGPMAMALLCEGHLGESVCSSPLLGARSRQARGPPSSAGKQRGQRRPCRP